MASKGVVDMGAPPPIEVCSELKACASVKRMSEMFSLLPDR